MLFDGTNKPIPNSNSAIKKALQGNTSMVQTKSSHTSILYDEENGEIDIFQGNSPVHTFELSEIDRAIKAFVVLVENDPE